MRYARTRFLVLKHCFKLSDDLKRRLKTSWCKGRLKSSFQTALLFIHSKSNSQTRQSPAHGRWGVLGRGFLGRL